MVSVAKTVSIDWNEFMRGNVVPKKGDERIGFILKTAAGVHFMLIPQHAFAATSEDSWIKLFAKVMEIVDWIAVGVFVFTGLTWMFGNRTKAVELFFGGSVGYLIARHAVDIRDWLKTI
jgi:hypothetical protein